MLRSLLYPPTRRELVLLLSFILVLLLVVQPDVTSHLSEYRAYLPLPIPDVSLSTPTSHPKIPRPSGAPGSEDGMEGVELDWDGIPDMEELIDEAAQEASELGDDDLPPKQKIEQNDLLTMFGPQREPYAADIREYWQGRKMKPSNVVSHAPGFTIFENLYFLNGTAYIVSNDPESFPARNLITGSGFGIYNSPEEIAMREPTDKDMQIVSPERAREIFGDAAVRLHGTTWWTNDPPQFIAHYYHFNAELLFGLWRTYASLDPSITPLGQTRLPAPRRWMFPHVPNDKWRDYASMNQYVLFASFPSVQLLFQQDVADMADTGKAYLLDRVIYSDRSAAIRGEGWLPRQRMAALAFIHDTVRNWWAPIRSNVVRFAGGDLNPFLRPHPPKPQPGQPAPVWDEKEDKPVITYVSRQTWGRRMLREEDHERFVAALERLRQEHGYEVNVVNMDKLSRDEQIRLAGRTTIMCGVHGNGLTSLLWMKPTPRTTVMEFFMPQGWAFDYQWTATALGMTHYGWWNDTYVTGNDIPHQTNYVEGFQGNEIPLDGEAVARAIHERLQIPLEDVAAIPAGAGHQ